MPLTLSPKPHSCVFGESIFERTIHLYTSASGENAQADGMFDFGIIMVPITHLGIYPYLTLRLSLLLHTASKHGWNSLQSTLSANFFSIHFIRIEVLLVTVRVLT